MCQHSLVINLNGSIFINVKKQGIYLILAGNRQHPQGSPGAPEAPFSSGQVRVPPVCRHKRQQVLTALFCCSPWPPPSPRASRSLTQIPPFWLRRSNVTLEAFNTDPTVIRSRIKMPRHLGRLGSETRMSPGPDRCRVCSLFICRQQ